LIGFSTSNRCGRLYIVIDQKYFTGGNWPLGKVSVYEALLRERFASASAHG
jgi:hypothetical protein